MIAPNEHTGGKGRQNNDADFKNLVDLLSVRSEVENQLEELQAEANQDYLQTIDSKKDEYSKLQAKLLETDKALELITRRHPEWLTEKKTIKTPYGSVSLKENPPKIVVDNEELSIVLIEAEATRDPEFDPKPFIRETKELNLEALAGCTDEQLKKFRLKREKTDTFSVKSAKLDMGKAVKEAADKDKK